MLKFQDIIPMLLDGKSFYSITYKRTICIDCDGDIIAKNEKYCQFVNINKAFLLINDWKEV